MCVWVVYVCVCWCVCVCMCVCVRVCLCVCTHPLLYTPLQKGVYVLHTYCTHTCIHDDVLTTNRYDRCAIVYCCLINWVLELWASWRREERVIPPETRNTGMGGCSNNNMSNARENWCKSAYTKMWTYAYIPATLGGCQMNKYICIVHTDASSVCVHTHYYTHPSKRVCMCYICIVRTPTKCCAQNEGTDRYAE